MDDVKKEPTKFNWTKLLAILALIISAADAALQQVSLAPPASVMGTAPEEFIILNSEGVRIDSPEIEAIAKNLTVGTWYVQAIPAPGNRGYFGSIVTTRLGQIPAPDATPKPDNPDVKPAPDNSPPPAPVDPASHLQGFAREVYEHAKTLPADECVALAQNYRTVANMIFRGGIKELADARDTLSQKNKSLNLNKATWSSFANWLGGVFEAKGQILGDAQNLMTAVADGLEARNGLEAR